MSAKQIEDYARSILKWFDLDPRSPFWETVRTRGGKVSMLALCVDDKEPNELSFVCQKSTGEFWTVENNPMIQCRRWTGRTFGALQDAKDDVYAWTLSEVIRTMKIVMEFKHEILSTFKKRDIEAHAAYLKTAIRTVIFGKGTSFSDAFKFGFKSGVDWILRSEGVVRRPSWAAYLVQNQNGSQTWFETEPVVDINSGRWSCKGGRSQDVQVHSESWTGSLRKLK